MTRRLQILALAARARHFAVLPDVELLALADVVGAHVGIELVTKDERANAVEAQLARDLSEDYENDLLSAADTELAALPDGDLDPARVDVALRGIGDRLDARDVTLATSLLVSALQTLAELGRMKVLGRSPKIPNGTNLAGSLSQVDIDAVGVMARSQLWWIGDLWNKSLSRRISATVSKAALEGGLGRAQVRKILGGVVMGTAGGVAVPETWPGSVGQYFEMLSGTVRNRASAFGSLTAMRDGGWTAYRIVAVMDERTSDRCRFMNNRVFRVADGLSHVNRTLAARDPDALKAVAGWRTADEMRTLAGVGDAESQRANLASAGLALPPYHARCRTEIVED